MRTKDLRDKIQIKTKSSVAASTGGLSVSYVLLTTVWAKADPMGGDETFETDKSTESNKYKFTIHYRQDIDTTNLITFRGKDYDIRNVQMSFDRERWTVIEAEERTEPGFTISFTALTSFSYTNNNQSASGTITDMAPIVSGDVASYFLDANDTLPTGITLDSVTGVISGSFTDGSQADFTIIAFGKDGTSTAAAEVTIIPGVAIPAPSALTATTQSATEIDLSWTDNGGGVYSFRIERSLTSGSGFTEIDSVGAGVTSYNDTGLTASTQYFYQVRATDGVGGFSSYSNEASDTTGAGFAFGNALRLDGVNDRVSLSSNVSANISQEFCFSGWIKPDSFSTKIVLGDGLDAQKFISLDSPTLIRINNSLTVQFTVPTMVSGTWYHLFITRVDSDNARVFINGTESSSGALSISNAAWGIGIYGTRSSFTNHYDGVLDECAFWTGVAGTSQNAIDLYNGGSGQLASDVISSPNFYHRFNESSGTTASDETANNNDGTLVNFVDPVATPGWEPH